MKFFHRDRLVRLAIAPVIAFTITWFWPREIHSLPLILTLTAIATVASWLLQLCITEPKLKVNWPLVQYCTCVPIVVLTVITLIKPPTNHEEWVTTVMISLVITILVSAAEFFLVGIPGKKRSEQ
jgi:hypothetical protein